MKGQKNNLHEYWLQGTEQFGDEYDRKRWLRRGEAMDEGFQTKIKESKAFVKGNWRLTMKIQDELRNLLKTEKSGGRKNKLDNGRRGRDELEGENQW